MFCHFLKNVGSLLRKSSLLQIEMSQLFLFKKVFLHFSGSMIFLRKAFLKSWGRLFIPRKDLLIFFGSLFIITAVVKKHAPELYNLRKQLMITCGVMKNRQTVVCCI